MSTKNSPSETSPRPRLNIGGVIRRVVGAFKMWNADEFDGYGGGECDVRQRFDNYQFHERPPTLFSGLSYTYPELERDMRLRRARERMTVIQLLIMTGGSGR